MTVEDTKEVSLGEVFSNIFVSPSEAAHLLHAWAEQHSGGAQTQLSGKLLQAASDVTEPPKAPEPTVEVVPPQS